MKTAVRPGAALLAAAALLPLVWSHALLGLGSDGLVGRWIFDAIFLLAAFACVAFAVVHRRLAAAAFGLGLLAFTAGNVVYSLAPNLDTVPVPSVSDPLWLAIYPCAYVALVALTRERVGRTLLATRLDGVLSGLAIAAVVACVSVPAAVDASAGESLAGRVTSLAYPIADLALLGAVVSAVALAGWRLDRRWGTLAAGIVAWETADLIYLLDSSGTQTRIADALVMTGVVAVAWGVCARPGAASSGATVGNRGLFVPVGFGALALALLIASSPLALDEVVIGLAGAALGLVLVRMTIALRENRGLLATSQVEATTDALTGLGNRRRLKHDLTAILDAPVPPARALVMLDLNGFKSYNDNYGHGAGDALLTRLGAALAAAVGERGAAYRMGGDEFCVLAPLPTDVEAFGLLCAEALSLRGDGFSITAAHGVVVIPHEAQDGSAALALADARMYHEKSTGQRPAAHQSAAVLLAMVEERAPELARGMHAVQSLACALATELGLHGDEAEALRHAAGLHDIGKLAIPEAILDKPGPLSEAEWHLVRRHPLIGERILVAAPALERSGQLVRASHERVDGTGYPDALRDGDIPLAARILAVADAYTAMTSTRPYRAALSTDAALAELHAGAHSQFDADAVSALARVLARDEVTPLAS